MGIKKLKSILNELEQYGSTVFDIKNEKEYKSIYNAYVRYYNSVLHKKFKTNRFENKLIITRLK